MATLSERLAEAITAQKSEIARIKDTHRVELEKANARLQALQAAKLAVTPELEQAIGQLTAAGIKVEA